MDYFEKIKSIVAEQLNVDPETITMNTRFDELNADSLDTTFVDDLGADSLDIFQIIMGIEDTFDIQIPDEEAEKIKNISAVVDYISDHV